MKKLNEQQMFNILTRILDKKDLASLAENIVFEDSDGSYQLYGKYSIKKQTGKYILHKNHTYVVETFFNLRNAVIYTTLDKRNLIMDAKRVLELDTLQEGSMTSIDLYRTLINKTKDVEKKSLYSTKLKEGITKKNMIEKELYSYAISSKRWQEHRFSQATK